MQKNIAIKFKPTEASKVTYSNSPRPTLEVSERVVETLPGTPGQVLRPMKRTMTY